MKPGLASGSQVGGGEVSTSPNTISNDKRSKAAFQLPSSLGWVPSYKAHIENSTQQPYRLLHKIFPVKFNLLNIKRVSSLSRHYVVLVQVFSQVLMTVVWALT